MKKYIPIFIILLFLCGFTEGETLECTDAKCPGTYELAMSPVFLSGGGAVAALTCSGVTIQQSETTLNSAVNFASSAAINDWRATEITYGGSTGTLCRFDVNINCTTSDCAQIITGHLYADSGSNTVGALVADCSGTYDTAPLSTDDTWVSFSSCSGTITNGTKYWLVITSNSVNGTNYIELSTDSGCETENHGYSGDGASWTYATTYCMMYRVYILE
jgi:hypothetical protein